VPRRHRAARERGVAPIRPERPTGVAPEWAAAEGFSVRAVAGEGEKAYRCPGCQQEIRPGTPHLVVVEEKDVEGRRHWHTPCWRQELRRRGLAEP
jgi:hypothetical protein